MALKCDLCPDRGRARASCPEGAMFSWKVTNSLTNRVSVRAQCWPRLRQVREAALVKAQEE